MPIDIERLREIVLAGTRPGHDQLDAADAILLPPGYTLADLEKYREQPFRMRGTYVTTRLPEFVSYLDQMADESSRLFVDPEAMTALCRLDHGSIGGPLWGEAKAKLTIKKSPEYAALSAILGKSLSQEELVDYLLDWAPALAFSTDVADISVEQAVTLIRKIETKTGAKSTHETTDTKRERSLLESAAVTSQPPAIMTLTCRPYDDLGERELTVRLAYFPTDPPKIKLRLLGAERLAVDLAEEFRFALTQELGLLRSDTRELCARTHIGSYA